MLDPRRSPMRTCLIVLVACFLAFIPFLPRTSAGDKDKVGPDPKLWETTARRAIGHLKTTQEKSGGWTTEKSPGVTGVCLAGMLQSGLVTTKDPVAEKALS